MSEPLYPRRALYACRRALQGFRAVVLQGARQVGKSTLAAQLADEVGASFLNLDDGAIRQAALDDPGLLLSSVGTPAVIDEVQRAGDDLLLAIKQTLDASNARGQYVLTGSTNFLTTPRLSESLAGRIDLVTLWPLAMGELLDGNDDFIDRAFAGTDALVEHRGNAPDRADYLQLLCNGGYPEPQRLDTEQRQRWHQRYLETVLRREVTTATDLRKFDALHTMARLLLASTGSELIISKLAEQSGIDRATAQTYEPWLETTFLVHRVPAWARTARRKAVLRPKIYACDTGLACMIAGKDPEALARPTDTSVGALMESFVVAELAKQLTWCATNARLHHLRERGGREIDAVLEAADGRVVAIEVKAATVARSDDVRHMANLRAQLDGTAGTFCAGVVLHTGKQRTRLGDRLVALPIADLWT